MAGFALFVVRRLLGIAALAWLSTLAAFGLFHAGVPNRAADAQLNAQLGPGKPITWQYFHYLVRLLHGDLGQSLTQGLSVDALLWRALPPTLSLMIGGLVLWLAIGVLAGIVSALRPGSLADRIIIGGTLTAMIVPTFLAALLLLELSAYLNRFGWLWLQSGYVPFSHNPGAWLGRMILPWIAVAATQAGLTARITRSAILDVLSEDYIRMARAKGVDRRRILLRHVLRPAVIPVITTAAAGFGTLLGAAAIVDETFALNGIGQALLTAVKTGDLMTIMGTVLITVILICLASLLADIAQKILDPQVT
ncbi:MAG TPA: ABC transporter permease [Streptosporangiaceae bacterium]|nr:ABC transporter permease [Streptosporangiaceae bacterium]